MPNNKIVWNLKDLKKNDFFTYSLSKDLVGCSDRQLSAFHIEYEGWKIIRYNRIVKHFTYDKILSQSKM